VEGDSAGVGYSGIGYKTSGVRAVPISFKGGPIPPTQKNTENFTYPIARYLYIYINKNPVKGTDPVVKEFIKFVLSKQGQEITIKDGYFPLNAKKVIENLALLEE
jgi:phosphate transport system substrate-binding protein